MAESTTSPRPRPVSFQCSPGDRCQYCLFISPIVSRLTRNLHGVPISWSWPFPSRGGPLCASGQSEWGAWRPPTRERTHSVHRGACLQGQGWGCCHPGTLRVRGCGKLGSGRSHAGQNGGRALRAVRRVCLAGHAAVSAFASNKCGTRRCPATEPWWRPHASCRRRPATAQPPHLLPCTPPRPLADPRPTCHVCGNHSHVPQPESADFREL